MSEIDLDRLEQLDGADYEMAVIRAAPALIAAVRERDELRRVLTLSGKTNLSLVEAYAEQTAELTTIRAQLEEAREALKPFAKVKAIFKGTDEDGPWDTPELPDSLGLEITLATTPDGACDLTLGQFRRARAVHAKLQPFGETT